MESVRVEWKGKNLSPNQSGWKWEGLYMTLPLPKREGELGAKVGKRKFLFAGNGANKFSDRCQKELEKRSVLLECATMTAVS